MIIKFREERIAELESKLAKAQEDMTSTTATSDSAMGAGDDCTECQGLKKQLDDAKKEISQWVECAEKNPQAAKLFAEKEELLTVKTAL